MRAWSIHTGGITGTVVQQASEPGEGWLQVPMGTLPGQILDGDTYRDATGEELLAAGFKRYAEVVSGVVISSTIALSPPPGCIEAPAWVGNGCVYDGEEFGAPPPPPPPKRHISKLAFRNRFTPAEKAGMELAAIHDHTQAIQSQANLRAANVRVQLADQRDAEYIDLNRVDLRAGVQGLEAGGLIAAGRAAQILDAEIQDHEIFRG